MSHIRSIDSKPFIEVENVSLDEWLSHLFLPGHKRKYRFTDFQFPTPHHRDEFLELVHTYPEHQIRSLLRNFLVPYGTLGSDKEIRNWISRLSPSEWSQMVEKREFMRRLVEPPFLPWEGITWVLDLLPHYPTKSLHILDGYFTAHCQELPDGRIQGLIDAETVIRHRYLQKENTRESLLSLGAREFEYLIGALYKKMGYRALVTKASRDGGIDVEATRDDPGGRELVLIQCKRYEGNIPVSAVRELTGVVARRLANKGVLATTSGFTTTARREAAENSMIELLDFSTLNKLFNQYFGAKWPDHITHEMRWFQLTTSRQAQTAQQA